MADAPQPAQSVLVSETRKGRFQVEATAGGIRFLIDEATTAGGLGSGPDPYDLLSAALGACTTMTLRLYADHKGWPLDHVQTKVVHHRASLEAKDRFERIIDIQGPLDETQRARLLEIAEHCPVHKTLDRGANIETHFGPPGETAPQPVPPEHMVAMNQAAFSLG